MPVQWMLLVTGVCDDEDEVPLLSSLGYLVEAVAVFI
jgi:hypothetical protein